jgi:inner membrane transporter RhtA
VLSLSEKTARPAAPPRPALSRVPAPVLLASGIISVQVGAGIAARMFGTVSAAGLTGLRLWIGCLILLGLGARPALRAVRGVITDRAWRDAAVVGCFGLTLAIMNFSIYQAFARIPLGIAVTVEFLGPLAVAIATSRRLIDLLWVVLAGTGVVLLGTAGTSLTALVNPSAGYSGSPGHTVLIGYGYALLAGASWATYILLSAATGKRFTGSAGLVIAMTIGAIVITPVAVASAGSALLRPAVLGVGVAIGLLSSVIPYGFELETLRRVPPRVFGIWMSLEPAVAALVGIVLLSQALLGLQWLAIGCVVIASAGAAFSTAEPLPDTTGQIP